MGPFTIPNISRSHWFVSLIDDCTKVTWIFLIKQKSDVSSVVSNFHSMIQNQFGVKIKIFRSNNARHYFNQILTSYFQKEGIIHESSYVNTPQQSRVAKRKNSHLLYTTRALLFQGDVPKSYWGEVVLIATYMINRLPSQILYFKAPLEILAKFYPHVRTSSNIIPRVFGCTSFVHVHSQNRGKLYPKAIKCVFLGYSSTQKGYTCYHPSSRKFYISTDVTFAENKSYFTQSYLRGETSLMKEKYCGDLNSFRPLDLPSISSPSTQKQNVPTFIESI